jgi:hypothetical protein
VTTPVGPPAPRTDGTFRGRADRVAEVLTARTDALRYANLGVRGRLFQCHHTDRAAIAKIESDRGGLTAIPPSPDGPLPPSPTAPESLTTSFGELP